MKKVYTIKIANTKKYKGIWYFNKNEQEFEAELKSQSGEGSAVFQVTLGKHVYPVDCIVVSEKLVQI